MTVESQLNVCYRHPKEETRLSCGRCERPICTRCSVLGPAGVRCRECASLRGSALFKVSPGRLVLAAALGLIAGVVGAEILFYVGFLIFFVGPGYGYAVAEIVTRASGRKVGPGIVAIGIGSIVLGTLIALGLDLVPWLAPHSAGAAAMQGLHMTLGDRLQLVMETSVWPLIGAGLAVSSCYARLRYF